MRHKINAAQELDYTDYLNARDTQNDVGVDIKNPTERLNIENVFNSIKRLNNIKRHFFVNKVDYMQQENKFSAINQILIIN